MNSKIAAVIVTYNRKEKLLKNLKCVLNQNRKLNKIYIIDNNSTDGTKEYINKILNNENIKYIKLNKNIGGSGGFYEGIKNAYNDGFDFIWGMDDDAFPDVNALMELEKVSQKLGKLVCLCSNCDNDNKFYSDYKAVNTWMFVGFYISHEVIKKVGFPRNDFFIYHDDSEYAYRIINNGFKIFKVKKSIIDHGNFNSREIYSKNVFNKEVSLPKMSDWKFYYFTRNAILMYKFNDKNKYKELFINCPKIFIKLMIVDKKQINIFLKAFLHGILGISGKRLSP